MSICTFDDIFCDGEQTAQRIMLMQGRMERSFAETNTVISDNKSSNTQVGSKVESEKDLKRRISTSRTEIQQT